MSPYLTSIDELVARFNTSGERRSILQGLVRFRRDLRQIGLQGWQWLDGSFLEDIEARESRPPRDLDLVTFTARPASIQSVAQLQAFTAQHVALFDRTQTKQNYLCDAFFVDLSVGPYSVVSQARYWFGLFSHQRMTAVWKGMLEIALPPQDSDAAARAALGVT